MKPKEKPVRPPVPELPMDTVDASAGFGLLAGLLSVGVAYFSGLVVALAALTAGVAASRYVDRNRGPPRRGGWALGFGIASVGWAGFLLPGVVPPPFRGALLGGSLLPLWLLARRPRPFGGV